MEITKGFLSTVPWADPQEIEKTLKSINEENHPVFSGYFVQDLEEEVDEIFYDYDRYFRVDNDIICLRYH